MDNFGPLDWRRVAVEGESLDDEYEYWAGQLVWALDIGPSAKEDAKAIRRIMAEIAELM